MTVADLGTAVEKAAVAKAAKILDSIRPDDAASRLVIGIFTMQPPSWTGPDSIPLHGRHVRFVACPSVLAVMDALAGQDGADGGVLVLLTDQTQDDLGDAIMSRLFDYRLHDVSRHTMLNDLLQPKQADVRIRDKEFAWLADALIELAQVGEVSALQGKVLTVELGVAHVLREKLGIDPADLDLVKVVEFADDTTKRNRWRSLPRVQQEGLIEWMTDLLGEPAGLVLRLAGERDDVLADLFVADVLTAPAADPDVATLFGGFANSRWGAPWPSAAQARSAADAAVRVAHSADNERIAQQVRRADVMLAELGGTRYSHHSTVLPSGFDQRLRHAAGVLDDAGLALLRGHRDHRDKAALIRRVEAAARLTRWLSTPVEKHDSVRGWLDGYARRLAWVDRELVHLRKGSSVSEVGEVFARLGRDVSARRKKMDLAFADKLSTVAESTPESLLAVETVLPRVIAPLVQSHRVLMVILDGMSMPVAIEIAESVTAGGRSGWTEVVRSADGGREAVVATFPTETAYSRTSLLAASLCAGDAGTERNVFGRHRFWPPRTRTLLVHKDGVAGAEGNDLGAELAEALGSDHARQVVAVVLNAVDESLPSSRQSDDPSWSHRDVPGLPELIERAAVGGWIVVLTSDHGHVLEHGSHHRHNPTGGARWRQAGSGEEAKDEVLLSGQRVLVPGNRAVLVATEDLRYGGKARGYHGGAALAEVSIPLVVLLPPGMQGLDNWAFETLGAPDWWTGRPAASSPPRIEVKPRPSGKQPVRPQQQADLFAARSSRGRLLVESDTFKAVHSGFARNRVPSPEMVAAIVDVLSDAGGRLPVAAVLQAAGTPGRNPRGLIGALKRLLNIDHFTVIDLVDNDRTVVLERELLDEQFPVDEQS